MLETSMDETIKVWVFFHKGIFPVAMFWQQRLIKFEKLIFASRRRIGQKEVVDLICQGETATYQLEFDKETYIWKIKKIMPKE